MLKKILSCILSGLFMASFGCASMNQGLESANKGAKEVGKTTGKATRIPTSVTEGAADGYAGEEESNPYDR
jgi:hypothetical protein